MINRKQAEEAALILNVVNMDDCVPEHVHERYRTEAKLSHPDVGGTDQEFMALATARDTLLEWIPIRVPAAETSTECPACDGTGGVNVQRGFRQMRVMCSACRGTGDATVEG